MRLWFFVSSAALFAGIIGACGLDIVVNDDPDDGGPPGDESPITPSVDAGAPNTEDAGDGGTTDSGPSGPVTLAYAHSPTTLYVIDIETNQPRRVADFGGDCAAGSLVDLAIDSAGNAYVSTGDGLYRLDLATASCTKISAGVAGPNSLAFVHRGDAGTEELVGYFGGNYSKIDRWDGGVTTLGSLGGSYVSSGDLVEVPDGGTFLTIAGNGCNDCLARVDPTTGALLENFGTVNHAFVYGVAAWGQRIYGFADNGAFFSMDLVDGGVRTQDIATDAGASSWYGAGSALVSPSSAAGDAGDAGDAGNAGDAGLP